MKYHVEEKNDQVILENVDSFELPHIFECGQCFRWNREEDGSYTGVAKGKIINVQKSGDQIIFNNTNMKDFNNIWFDYFDLGRDYEFIKDALRKNDEVMGKSMEYGNGIRILKQDEWETMLSFIISANRGISLIKKSIEALSTRYGSYLGEYRGKKYYDFPKPHVIANKSVEEIKESHTGYRAKYMVNTSIMVTKKEIDIYCLQALTTEEARNQLIKFPGVGPKVADCILLFSMDKGDAFPIDVWVKRVMEYFYLPEGTSLKEIQGFARKQFGNLGGFAQQYLFYYARQLGIGKATKSQ